MTRQRRRRTKRMPDAAWPPERIAELARRIEWQDATITQGRVFGYPPNHECYGTKHLIDWPCTASGCMARFGPYRWALDQGWRFAIVDPYSTIAGPVTRVHLAGPHSDERGGRTYLTQVTAPTLAAAICEAVYQATEPEEAA